MQKRHWKIFEPSPEIVRQLSVSLDITPTLAAVLANRGIDTPETASLFLNPDLDSLHDPFLMKGMTAAVDLLRQAIGTGTPILVFGDYDVDGVTGTALLVAFLKQYTDLVEYYIPHRVHEGYGLQTERLRRFAADGGGMVLSVDCGISHAAEVEAGRALGLSFIITDHHEPPAELPAAEAILNPLQPGCPYPFKHLAGVGIAFKLVQGLESRLGPGPAPAFSFIDLVALGTVADIVPLQDENRILVRHGLHLLNSPDRTGVTALKSVSGLGSRTLRSSHIAFALGPRINAAGRLGRADVAVDLLLESEPGRAMSLAEGLNEENFRRRQIEAQIHREATGIIEGDPTLLDDRILVLASPLWHSGVIGIVASKFAERYSRPAILISTESDPGKGSARSVPSFDLYSALQQSRHLLETFGGHSYAAGLSILEENIPLLRRSLNDIDAPSGGPLGGGAVLDIDARVDFDKLRAPLLSELTSLMPFGYTNPAPVFLAERVYLKRPPRTVGKNHLRLGLTQKPFTRQAIGFNMGNLAESLSMDLSFNVAYSLEIDVRLPAAEQQLRICDIQFPYSFEPSDDDF